jgi:hypothetical protein
MFRAPKFRHHVPRTKPRSTWSSGPPWGWSRGMVTAITNVDVLITHTQMP